MLIDGQDILHRAQPAGENYRGIHQASQTHGSILVVSALIRGMELQPRPLISMASMPASAKAWPMGKKLFDGEPARHFVRGVDLDPYGVIRANGLADGMVDFQHDAQAVFHRAAILICAPVEDGRDEMGEQVAVGTMDLHAVKPSLFHAHGRVCKKLDNGADVVFGHLLRRQPTGGMYESGGPQDAGRVGVSLAVRAAMHDLHEDLGTQRMHGVHNLFGNRGSCHRNRYRAGFGGLLVIGNVGIAG